MTSPSFFTWAQGLARLLRLARNSLGGPGRPGAHHLLASAFIAAGITEPHLLECNYLKLVKRFYQMSCIPRSRVWNFQKHELFPLYKSLCLHSRAPTRGRVLGDRKEPRESSYRKQPNNVKGRSLDSSVMVQVK